MTNNPKDRARKALENYYTKQIKKSGPPKKNRKPEKEVAKWCMDWMRSQDWSVQIVESKNTYNPQAGRWVSSSTKAGTADCLGTLPSGTFVAIEFKSPGRLSTFNADKNVRQRDYIIEKIHTYSFACVVDSVARLKEIYDAYVSALEVSKDKAKNVLLNYLP
jgi:hypothetical protein